MPGRDDEFTAYVTARTPWLRRVAYLLCQDWHRADDLVQTAITRLYLHWRRASAADNIDGYARTVLIRVFLAEQRGGWRRRVRLVPALPDGPDGPLDLAGDLDLREALAGLPPRQRAAVVLRFYCDLSVEQTADVLNCSTGTVKSQTARGLDALRRGLRPVQSLTDGENPA
ncbi:SigE family RNA polymerase sigma factor [Actinomadura sp. LD22]|uniref:SigE family RNA polymerase sigma factor n=1 Tax=Actinomadura physcomitrii TaxID=2650748 RepID=A0A6I4MQ21_9ACTN|nr:SigE family RNA polymerase sigma factor [Actinomadura physcomitrii]MWA06815.1 SigE family RNA polymerase sigma factor [Actinomadura physcomitrii]